MWTKEEVLKAERFVAEELPKRAVLDPEVGYQEEIEGIVMCANMRLNYPDETIRERYTDEVFTGQKDNDGNKAYFSVEEIRKAVEA